MFSGEVVGIALFFNVAGDSDGVEVVEETLELAPVGETVLVVAVRLFNVRAPVKLDLVSKSSYLHCETAVVMGGLQAGWRVVQLEADF